MSNQDTKKNAGFQNPSPPSALPKGKNYLLSIGIDKYTDLPPLFNAVKDAQEVVGVLLNKYQFEQTLVIELYNEAATKKNIYKKLRELTERVTPNDNVLIYFSGHGEYDKIAKEGYWIPVDAENGEESDYIPNTVIRKKLGTINSRHTFLMADSCFAGSLFAKGAGRNVGKRYERDPSRWGLTAGRNEIVSDGKAGDNSPFAESLLYRLRNNTGALNVQELCAHVTEYVLANSKQTPIGEPLQIEGHKNGQFVFHMKKDEVADWKTAIATGTLQGYELFLAKYPDGKYAAEGNAKIKMLKATEDWSTLKKMPDTTLAQIEDKLRSILSFTKKYPKSEYIQEVELLGENLHYKEEFQGIENNLFALKRFARRNTPYREVAQQRIDTLENEKLRHYQAEEEAKKERERQERLAEEEAKKERERQERLAEEEAKKERERQERLAEEEAKKERERQERLAEEEAKKERERQERLAEEEAKKERERQKRLAEEKAKKERQLQQKKLWAEEARQTRRELAEKKTRQERLAAERKKTSKILQPKVHIIKDPNIFTDPRDGQTYKTVKMKDGNIWLAENLNFDIVDGCYFYDDDFANGKKYGRLYTWEAAKKAVPKGWHLPTDVEWRDDEKLWWM